jgi:hypothetical protein
VVSTSIPEYPDNIQYPDGDQLISIRILDIIGIFRDTCGYHRNLP